MSKATTAIATDVDLEPRDWGKAQDGDSLRDDVAHLCQCIEDELHEIRDALSTRGTDEDVEEAIADALQHFIEIRGWAKAGIEELDIRTKR